ncbi:histidine phosphatase family protein [Pseudomonas orientalis]|uniref:histidine phosphatase family protein n=1 Tax=Pseudomonas orientalis TaxID=76758 RepID=UPI000F572506|nr:histidine phosphatase family protein [Pseudomonas orientalis]AZE89781.1 Phosphoglycerate mutase family protein [Pseudomonas orientalis]
MGSIYLIRHGQASFGADDYDVLSPVGVEQAQVLGRHLADLGLTFDRCLSGDLRRQQHTATAAFDQYSALGLPVPPLEIDSAFNEFDGEAIIRGLLPDLLGAEPNAMHILRNGAQNRSEFQRIFALIIERWLAGTYDPPGLESWQGFVERVEAGLQRILEAADNSHRIAVFTSGGTITALLHLITRMPVAQAFELNWQIVNTSLNQLKFRGREVALASFNSHTHLQLLKAPQLITFR